MPGLYYAGPPDPDGHGLPTQAQVEARLHAEITRDDVRKTENGVTSGITVDLAAVYAHTDYVDTQDARFVSETLDSESSYYRRRDKGTWIDPATGQPDTASALVPLAGDNNTGGVGQPGGVATLVGGKIPAAQIPNLGAGFLRGPYMATAYTPITGVGTTPVRIASWDLGVTAPVSNQLPIDCQILVFMAVAVVSTGGGRAVIDVRFGGVDTPFASQTPVAFGRGRNAYTGRQTVIVQPSPLPGQTPTAFPAAFPNPRLSAWLYDDGSRPGTTHTLADVVIKSIPTSGVNAASAWLLQVPVGG